MKRAQRLKIDGYKCRTCGAAAGVGVSLHVHHVTYERLGDEDVERDLITLCAECHAAVDNAIDRRQHEAPIIVENINVTVMGRPRRAETVDAQILRLAQALAQQGKQARAENGTDKMESAIERLARELADFLGMAERD